MPEKNPPEKLKVKILTIKRSYQIEFNEYDNGDVKMELRNSGFTNFDICELLEHTVKMIRQFENSKKN